MLLSIHAEVSVDTLKIFIQDGYEHKDEAEKLAAQLGPLDNTREQIWACIPQMIQRHRRQLFNTNFQRPLALPPETGYA